MEKRFTHWKKPVIKHGKLTKWNWLVQYPEGLTLGKHTDIGAFTYINAQKGVMIGDAVEIGSHCSLYSVSTIDGKKGSVTIGKGARIGTHSTVMPGVTIGEGALVAAYSFVNKDVPANAVVAGVPARLLRRNGSRNPS